MRQDLIPPTRFEESLQAFNSCDSLNFDDLTLFGLIFYFVLLFFKQNFIVF